MRKAGVRHTTAHQDAADNLHPKVRGKRAKDEHLHDLETRASRERLGKQVAAEEIQVHEHEGAEQLRKLYDVRLVKIQIASFTAARWL